MKTVLGRAILPLVVFFLLLALVMFLPAGTGWRQGWVFLAVLFLQMASMGVYLWRKNPEILVARSKIHRGTKTWDRVLFYIIQVVVLAVFLVAGFDDRFHWSSTSLWVFVVGYVLLTVGMAGITWVLSVNKFAEMSVRIQTERGHKVVDTGPYGIVRHPFYVATFFFFGGIPLALGSLWAMIPAVVVSLVLVVRTVWEDRTLQSELSGYKEYASRVRYKLLPGIW